MGGTMGRFPTDRYFYALMVGALAILLGAMVFLMALGLDPYTILWLSLVTGSTIGMMFYMVLLVKAMDGEDGRASS